jgi:hypothetical protein
MKRILLLAVITIFAVTITGCCNHGTGSREFIPGKGWVPNN